jgi:L-alanine-DL-glutamate epimerase-like enolase superfamily enzyme
MWLEEPVWPPESYDGLTKVRRRRQRPIAAGKKRAALIEFDRRF